MAAKASQKVQRIQQDMQERLRIRKSYRENQEALEKAADLTPEFLLDILEVGNEEFKRVKLVQEAVRDTAFLRVLTGRALKEILKDHATDYDPAMFPERLAAFSRRGRAAEGTDVDWVALGSKAFSHSFLAPSPVFLYGPLAMDITKRKVAQRRERQKNDDPVLTVEEPSGKGENLEEETTTRINGLFHALTKYRETHRHWPSFFAVVVHPRDFAATIENIFHLSFLVRDGVVAIINGDDGVPIVEVVQAKKKDGPAASGEMRQQLVLEFTEDNWRQAIETFNIREPLVPAAKRAVSTVPAAGQARHGAPAPAPAAAAAAAAAGPASAKKTGHENKKARKPITQQEDDDD